MAVERLGLYHLFWLEVFRGSPFLLMTITIKLKEKNFSRPDLVVQTIYFYCREGSEEEVKMCRLIVNVVEPTN